MELMMEKEFTQTQHRSVTDVPPVISVKHFNLWYTNFQALKAISLDIPEHRATAFIGPSGCGKSTLLRTFNRMCDFVEGVRTEGLVEFKGADVFKTDANALRVHVGMVFQHPNPFPMSIRENILYGPKRMRRLSKAEGDEICERCLTRAALWDEVKDDLSMDLFEEGLLDSLGVAQLLMELEDSLGIVIALTEIEKEDINTPEKIVALAMQRNAEG